MPVRRQVVELWQPVIGALVVAAPGSWLGHALISPACVDELAAGRGLVLTAGESDAVRVVWGLHSGLYAGALLGLASACFRLARSSGR